MMESWLKYRILRFRYQVALCKWQFTKFWYNLDGFSRSLFVIGSCGGIGLLTYKVLNWLDKSDQAYGNRITDDHGFSSGPSELSEKRRKTGLPPGLFNHGNTCFVNCVLQALSSLESIIKWLGHVSCTKGRQYDLTLFPSVNALVRVLANQCGKEDCYSAQDLLMSLTAHGWHISPEQQDAHELLQVVLSTLSEEAKRQEPCSIYALHCSEEWKEKFLVKPLSLKCQISSNATDAIESCDNLSSGVLNRICHNLPLLHGDDQGIKMDSPFKGYFASRMTCMECGYQMPVKFEPFDTINLSLQHLSFYGATLHACLNKFVSSELVHSVTCVGCWRMRSGAQSTASEVTSSFSKQTSIAKLPKCLCFHLQRTYFHVDGSTYKNPIYVRFPEIFDIQPYTYYEKAYSARQSGNSASSKGDMPAVPLLLGGSESGSTSEGTNVRCNVNSSASRYSYTLKAIIIHFGEATDGHFITYRRSPGNPEKWLYVSDELVKPAPKSEVMASNAYMLFYERNNRSSDRNST